MIKIEANWLDLRYLDDLARRQTVIQQINPVAKILTTIVFILMVTSFPKYEISGLIPFFFYPFFLMALGQLPADIILKRLLLVAPFVIFIGIFNPLLDRAPAAQFGSLLISGGWLSLTSITLRLLLTVTAALILVATTGVNGICAGLFRLGVPKVIVVQLLFMYRYLHVLLEELSRCLLAYRLRSFHGSGLHYKAWGSLLGQLLIRTVDRAQRIYQAMRCRGFDGEVRMVQPLLFKAGDFFYLLCWVSFFVLARFFNIAQLVGNLLLGGKS